MERKANPWRNATLPLILAALVAVALFVALRPIRFESPVSGSGEALLNLDDALGATVEPLDPGTAGMLGLSSSAGDLVVTSVGTGRPAAAAGLHVGDIIEQIGGKPAAASAAPSEPTTIEINRRGKHAILQIAFAARPGE